MSKSWRKYGSKGPDAEVRVYVQGQSMKSDPVAVITRAVAYQFERAGLGSIERRGEALVVDASLVAAVRGVSCTPGARLIEDAVIHRKRLARAIVEAWRPSVVCG